MSVHRIPKATGVQRPRYPTIAGRKVVEIYYQAADLQGGWSIAVSYAKMLSLKTTPISICEMQNEDGPRLQPNELQREACLLHRKPPFTKSSTAFVTAFAS